jgi:hypothetical protein
MNFSVTKDRTPHIAFTADRTSYKETEQIITLRSRTSRALAQSPSTGGTQTLYGPHAVPTGSANLADPDILFLAVYCCKF